MAELDTIAVVNPTKEEFVVRFNGEPYRIEAGETRTWPKFLAFHVAKHLSDKIIGKDIAKVKAQKTDSPFRPQVGQLQLYDNPTRRIALYDILNDKLLVEECIKSYPFKGFIGEMKDYDDYVAKVREKAA